MGNGILMSFSRAGLVLFSLLASLTQANTLDIVGDGGRIKLVLAEGFLAADGQPLVHDGQPLGQQRIDVMSAAAKFWADHLIITEPIVINVRFADLLCSSGGAVLGSAGPAQVISDFVGAPHQGAWYPIALANQLAGRDLMPAVADINVRFNSRIDYGCMPGASWYYGVDAMSSPPGTFALYNTAVHEIAHGLGFTTMMDVSTGQVARGLVDHYMLNLSDVRGLSLSQMTAAQRQAAATSEQVFWAGEHARSVSQDITGIDRVRMHAPRELRRGSSLSHFSTSINSQAPAETMGPYFVSGSSLWLSMATLADMGWGLVRRSDYFVMAMSDAMPQVGRWVQVRAAVDVAGLEQAGKDQIHLQVTGGELKMEGVPQEACLKLAANAMRCSVAQLQQMDFDRLQIKVSVRFAAQGPARVVLAATDEQQMLSSSVTLGQDYYVDTRLDVRAALKHQQPETGSVSWWFFCGLVSVLLVFGLRRQGFLPKKH